MLSSPYSYNMNDYNIAILAVIKMIVDNNAGCVARKLRETGYKSTQDVIPAGEMESALFQLHTGQRDLFFDVMKKCQWNNGIKNWTNDNNIYEKIISSVQKRTGITVDKNNWWSVTMNYLQNK